MAYVWCSRSNNRMEYAPLRGAGPRYRSAVHAGRWAHEHGMNSQRSLKT
jgi:hypothetical protein